MKDNNGSGAGKLRVLFVDYGIGFGGAVISLCELVNNLPDHIDSHVLSAQKREIIVPLLSHGMHLPFWMPINYVQRERLTVWLESRRLPSWLKLFVTKSYAVLDWLAGYYYSFVIYRTIRRFRIELLHINNQADVNIIRAATWAKVPCIVHTRGFGGVDKRMLRNRECSTTVRRFIAISNAVASYLEEAGVRSSLIEVIHNPVQMEKYEVARSARDSIRARWAIQQTDVVVAIFGRITEWKGQLEFLEAAQSIVARCPQLKLMIVGDASDDVRGYPGKVHSLAESALLAGKVVFTGYQQEVAGYYWASDIVVHNSIIPEPFGRVVIEAMACERPVIAMGEGGPIDILTNGVDGLLVPPRDTPALAHAIEALYSSTDQRSALARAAIASIREKFTGQVIAAKVAEIYGSTMQADLMKASQT
jgi:glycosyltransferase involved in cell wall biosynthesis